MRGRLLLSSTLRKVRERVENTVKYLSFWEIEVLNAKSNGYCPGI